MTTEETGAIDEEYRVEYVVDRVHTTTTTWLGLTAACARCHDHKFDPISQKEFFSLFAFFNNVPESGVGNRPGNAEPLLSLPSNQLQRQLDRLKSDITKIEREVFLTTPESADFQSLYKERNQLHDQYAELSASLPDMMVMRESKQPRETFVLIRGQYDQPGEKVVAGVPASLPPFPADLPRDRLGFAKWLVDPANPLTSRVIVNRYRLTDVEGIVVDDILV